MDDRQLGPDGWPQIPETPPAHGQGRDWQGDTRIPYHEMPLDPTRKEIRLATVYQRRPHPEEPEYYQLGMSFEVVSLLDDPPPVYKALSYVWNDQLPVDDARQVDSFIRSSKNKGLLMALKQLSRDEDVVIWVDALCINQNGEEEKTTQVSMMAAIYQSADEVIAWLGTHSELMVKALDVVDAWADFAARSQQELWFQDPRWINNAQLSKRQVMDTLERLVNDARTAVPEGFRDLATPGSGPFSFYLLGLTTYWSRAWIFQELAFASKARIQSGTRWTSLAAIMSAMKAWKAIRDLSRLIEPVIWDAPNVKYHTTELGHASGVYSEQIQRLGMYTMLSALANVRDSDRIARHTDTLTLEFLNTFSGFDATGPHDKIFALWGFVHPNGPHVALLRPDYSLTVEEVYTRVAWYMILTRKSLDILGHHPHGEPGVVQQLRGLGRNPAAKANLNLPSWVPDWRYKVGEDESFRAADASTDIYDFFDVVEVPDNSHLLRAKGIEGGQIKNTLGGSIFPYPLAGNAPEKSILDTVRYFIRNILARGQGVLCQYLRLAFKSMNPALWNDAQPLGSPLDILDGLANGRVELGTGTGNGHMLLLLLSVVNPVVKMIRGNRTTPHPFYGGATAAAPPAVFALLEVLDAALGNADGGGTSDDLRSFDWLAQIFDALSSPGGDRISNIMVAVQAIIAVKREEALDHARQKLERPDEHPWETLWSSGNTPSHFITADGHLGSYSKCIHPVTGDVVCRLAALSTPVILRPHGLGRYKLVGECFVTDRKIGNMGDTKVSEMKWFEIG